MGNALHYTQIKKSDLKFEPLAEFLAEDGDWLDITMISDSPLLEHDAMFMLQQCDKAKHRLFEKQARDDRRNKLAIAQGMDPEELAAREAQEKAKREAMDRIWRQAQVGQLTHSARKTKRRLTLSTESAEASPEAVGKRSFP